MSDSRTDDYYQLLGVPYDATHADITRAYRAAMKRFHPDRARPERRAAAEDLTKDLNRAYRTLSNPTERLAYDRSIRGTVAQDGLMRRYVGGPADLRSGSIDPLAQHLKRPPTPAERADRRRSERSAMFSVLSAFLILTLGAVGLLLVWALLALVADLLL